MRRPKGIPFDIGACVDYDYMDSPRISDDGRDLDELREANARAHLIQTELKFPYDYAECLSVAKIPLEQADLFGFAPNPEDTTASEDGFRLVVKARIPEIHSNIRLPRYIPGSYAENLEDLIIEDRENRQTEFLPALEIKRINRHHTFVGPVVDSSWAGPFSRWLGGEDTNQILPGTLLSVYFGDRVNLRDGVVLGVTFPANKAVGDNERDEAYWEKRRHGDAGAVVGRYETADDLVTLGDLPVFLDSDVLAALQVDKGSKGTGIVGSEDGKYTKEQIETNLNFLYARSLEPLEAYAAGKEGYSVVVTSGYRNADHNVDVGGKGRSGHHTYGLGMDIEIYGPDGELSADESIEFHRDSPAEGQVYYHDGHAHIWIEENWHE